jgi:hypothetical protein
MAVVGLPFVSPFSSSKHRNYLPAAVSHLPRKVCHFRKMPTDLSTVFATYSKGCRAKRPSSTIVEQLAAGLKDLPAQATEDAPTPRMKDVSPLSQQLAPSMQEASLRTPTLSSFGSSSAAGGPASPGSRVATIDLTGKYVGNRSLVALFREIRDLIPSLEVLKIPSARLFAGDNRPTGIAGNKVIEELRHCLTGHPSLRLVDLSGNEIGTNAYLELVPLLKGTPSLESLNVDGTLLLPHEQAHLLALAAINAKRKQAQATNLSVAGSRGDRRSPNSSKSPTQRQQPDFLGKGMLFRKLAPSAGIDEHVIQYEQHSLKPGVLSTATVKDIETRKSRMYISQVLSNVDAGQAQGSQSVKIPIQHPSMREYAKTPEQAEMLKKLLRETPQFRAFRQLVFPEIPTPAGEKTQNPKSLDFGPTVEEREYLDLVKAQGSQIDLVLDKLVASMQLGIYKNGEHIVESGEAATFVFLIEKGQGACERENMWRYLDLATVVLESRAAKPNASSSGAEELTHYVELQAGDGDGEVITLRPGTLFGENDLLAVDDAAAATLVRRMSAFARCPADKTLRLWLLHKDVFHMFLADPLAVSRASRRRLTDAMPAFTTCPQLLRSMFSDLLQTKVVTTRRSLSGETEAAEEFPLRDQQLAQHILVVDEGLIGVMRNDVLVAELGRGDVFLLQPGTPTAGLVLTHLPGNMPSWRYCIIPLSDLSLLPRELWKVLSLTSRIYDAAHAAAVKAKVDNQVSMLLVKSRNTARRNSQATNAAHSPNTKR